MEYDLDFMGDVWSVNDKYWRVTNDDKACIQKAWQNNNTVALLFMLVLIRLSV